MWQSESLLSVEQCGLSVPSFPPWVKVITWEVGAAQEPREVKLGTMKSFCEAPVVALSETSLPFLSYFSPQVIGV